MKVVAIIQARMNSTRLPGKVLKNIGGKTMLARVVGRAKRAKLLDSLMVATSVEPADQAIIAECEQLEVAHFCGSEDDVLDRYYRAAKACRTEVAVRITADCPLIEPDIIDRVVGAFLDVQPDYASNTLERTYPRGLDVEVIHMEALERTWYEAADKYQRIHVTPYIYQNPDRFQLLSVTAESNYSAYRWTVDEPEDLKFVRSVYARFDDRDVFSWLDVLHLLKQEPDLADMNRAIQQKSLQEG